MDGGKPIGASDNTRNGRQRAVGLPPRVHSRVGLDGLARLRLPVCQEIADVDICFQLSLFVVGQVAFIGANVKLCNPEGVVLGRIECEDTLSECRSHTITGESNTRWRTSA